MSPSKMLLVGLLVASLVAGVIAFNSTSVDDPQQPQQRTFYQFVITLIIAAGAALLIIAMAFADANARRYERNN